MQIMKIYLSIIFLSFIFVNILFSQSKSDEELNFDGYFLGTTIRKMEVDNIVIVDLPLIEARIPLYSRYIQLKYGGYLQWGITKFFVEWNYGTGIVFYPIGKYVGLSGNMRVGSFFFDNISYTGAIGIHFDLSCGSKKIFHSG